jgi:hypothetical protein
MSAWKPTDVVPEAGAGLVFAGPSDAITVPEGC